MKPKTELCWLRKPDDLTLPFTIRIHVFCDEQGYAQELELDQTDDVSWHLLLLANGFPAGTGRLYWRDSHQGIMGIGRLAGEKEWRQHGFGRILVKEMERKAAVLGAKMVLLDAQIRAIGFYEKLGYAVCGEEHMDGHVPHKLMNKSIKQK